MEKARLLKNIIAQRIMLVLTVGSGMIVFLIIFCLYRSSLPILKSKPLSELIFASSWHPLKGEFGFYPFISGTFWVTAIAVIMALPLCLLTAIYLSEYAPGNLREHAKPFIDLLAGIPSIVYGMWGVLVIVPIIKNNISPIFGYFSTGYSAISAGIVLAIMIAPVVIHVCLEVFRAVPYEMRAASLALGATKWQTVKHVVVRKALPGIIAAVVLGLSRAIGETMAVLMVAGNVAKIPTSIFDPAYPLPALIANNYGEMLSVPLYDAALLFAAFILLMIVLFFNVIARIVLIKVEKIIQ